MRATLEIRAVCLRWGLGTLVAAQTWGAVYRIEAVTGRSHLWDGIPALQAQLGTIQGVAVDNAGSVYLSDTDHHVVRRIRPDGIIVTLAGTGARSEERRVGKGERSG